MTTPTITNVTVRYDVWIVRDVRWDWYLTEHGQEPNWDHPISSSVDFGVSCLTRIGARWEARRAARRLARRAGKHYDEHWTYEATTERGTTTR